MQQTVSSCSSPLEPATLEVRAQVLMGEPTPLRRASVPLVNKSKAKSRRAGDGLGSRASRSENLASGIVCGR